MVLEGRRLAGDRRLGKHMQAMWLASRPAE